MILEKLYKDNIIHPPKWLLNSCHYLTIMGSEAYGVSSGSSDIDVYGFCVPPRHMVFPHEAGEIFGFGDQIQRFEQFQQHQCVDKSSRKEYDFAIYNIVKYFQLCMENNPNMTDSLWTPRRCILHITQMGEHVRANRKLFLHKGSFNKFRGYANSQLAKIQNKTNSSNPKRAADIEANGFDTKFAYHLVRLCNECEQILTNHELDLERDREQLKSIRRGEWTYERIVEWYTEKEKALEVIHAKSTLQDKPDQEVIKRLLLECLEMAYGSIDKAYKADQNISKLVSELETLIGKYR